MIAAVVVMFVAADDTGAGAKGGGALRSRPPKYVLHALVAGLREENLLEKNIMREENTKNEENKKKSL